MSINISAIDVSSVEGVRNFVINHPKLEDREFKVHDLVIGNDTITNLKLVGQIISISEVKSYRVSCFGYAETIFWDRDIYRPNEVPYSPEVGLFDKKWNGCKMGHISKIGGLEFTEPNLVLEQFKELLKKHNIPFHEPPLISISDIDLSTVKGVRAFVDNHPKLPIQDHSFEKFDIVIVGDDNYDPPVYVPAQIMEIKIVNGQKSYIVRSFGFNYLETYNCSHIYRPNEVKHSVTSGLYNPVWASEKMNSFPKLTLLEPEKVISQFKSLLTRYNIKFQEKEEEEKEKKEEVKPSIPLSTVKEFREFIINFPKLEKEDHEFQVDDLVFVRDVTSGSPLILPGQILKIERVNSTNIYTVRRFGKQDINNYFLRQIFRPNEVSYSSDQGLFNSVWNNDKMNERESLTLLNPEKVILQYEQLLKKHNIPIPNSKIPEVKPTTTLSSEKKELEFKPCDLLSGKFEITEGKLTSEGKVKVKLDHPILGKGIYEGCIVNSELSDPHAVFTSTDEKSVCGIKKYEGPIIRNNLGPNLGRNVSHSAVISYWSGEVYTGNVHEGIYLAGKGTLEFPSPKEYIKKEDMFYCTKVERIWKADFNMKSFTKENLYKLAFEGKELIIGEYINYEGEILKYVGEACGANKEGEGGWGVERQKNSTLYGFYKKGVICGFGVGELLDTNEIYIGNYVNGHRSGEGIFLFPNKNQIFYSNYWNVEKEKITEGCFVNPKEDLEILRLMKQAKELRKKCILFLSIKDTVTEQVIPIITDGLDQEIQELEKNIQIEEKEQERNGGLPSLVSRPCFYNFETKKVYVEQNNNTTINSSLPEELKVLLKEYVELNKEYRKPMEGVSPQNYPFFETKLKELVQEIEKKETLLQEKMEIE